MNLAEGYLGRAPPDLVRSVMPNSFSSRSLNSGTDGAQVGPYEDHMMHPEEHINGVGGTWPRQVQGHSNAKYLDIPLDNSTTFRPSTVPPSPRSRSNTRFLSQSMESPLWSDERPDSAARDQFASAAPPPSITIQDFSAVPTRAGFSHNAQRASPSERRRPFVTTVEAGPQNNERSLRSPLMSDRRHGAPSHQGPFYATSYDHPHQRWNNTTGGGGGGGVSAGFRSGTMHAISNGTGGATETGTGECYTRVTQQLMRDSENLPLDQFHPAMSQTRYVPQQSASYETTVKSLKAMLAFPPHGHGTPSTGEGSRNPDNVGYASVNKIPHLWRNPVGGVDLSGSGDSRGSNRTSTQVGLHSSDTNFTVRLADNTSRELRSADGTHLDTAAGERNRHPRPQHYAHDRSFSDDRFVSHGDTLPNDRSFSQDISNNSHDESFSSNRNLSHDRSFSNDDPRGTAAGKRTQLNGASAKVEDQVLYRWMTTFNDTTTTSEPVPNCQGYSSRFINEVLSSKYGRGGNDNHEDLASSGGLAEAQTEGAKNPATNGGKAMMGEHRKWIQMEDRLLIRIYELQKERSQLTVKVEELAVENRDLSRRFKDTAGQLERKSLEMETVRRQLRERIVDMTSTISSPQDSTPPSSFHRDAPPSTTSSNISSSNQRRCHDNDDDVDARRGRQVAQEELAACQIRFARERERWISEKMKVLRYQQLLQAKYEQVVAENQVLKEQAGIGKELCQNTTATRSATTQQRLTLLKDGPSGLSFDSVC